MDDGPEIEDSDRATGGGLHAAWVGVSKEGGGGGRRAGRDIESSSEDEMVVAISVRSRR